MNSSTKAKEKAGILARRPLKLLISIGAVVLVVYSTVCAGFYFWQDRLVFKPERGFGATPSQLGLPFEDVRIQAADGTKLGAWYVPGRSDGRTVLLLHGNGGNISRYMRTLVVLHNLGHGVLALDYRGYGVSAGRPTELGLYQDAAAAFDYLTAQRNIPAAQIVVYGRSLGGAVAAWLAAHRRPGALVLESTFTRLSDVGNYRYPWLPVRLLSRNYFDSVVQMAAVQCPVLITHGLADTTVPTALGRALASAAGPKARFLPLPGDHNNAFIKGGAAYYRHLDQFMRGTPID
jgi:uncharacterized protein